GLDGAGAQHHVEAELAPGRHVATHDPVAALGHPGDVLAPPLGLEADAEHADAERGGDRAHLIEMLVHLAAGLVQGLDRAPDSSNWPPGSRVTLAPPLLSAMGRPCSRTSSQPNSRARASSSARMPRSPSYGSGRRSSWV